MDRLFEKIRGNRFVVFGRAGMDLFAQDVGVKSEDAEVFQADLGGSSANTCVGLSKLGSGAALVTSVSNDAVGRFCINRLKHYGVSTDYIRSIDGEFRTSLAVYESRTEDFQNVLYRNGAADFQVTEADVNQVDYTRFDVALGAGTVFASEPSRSATFKAFTNAKAAGLPIVFDIDYRPYSWPSPEVASDVLTRAAEASDVIVGNDEEFDFMAGGAGKGLATAEHLATAGKLAIYKMGPDGAITFWSGQRIRTGVYPTQAIKPVGAGDSFLSGLLASLAAGHDLETAILRGSACAAITVSRPGCAPAMPTTEDLDAFLRDHPVPTQP
ncbi:MAG: 5-dehydro-2-deoxygluconokinase [Pseudomonadota bacterium]|nr:5-dehydro-2-deoxygluconokinase [Pseudomonadota bacterium]